MKRILLTGLSGTGKSTLVTELSARGYKAVDLDSPDWSQWVAWTPAPGEAGTPVEPDRDWVWREDRVLNLLETSTADILFISGCAANMAKFYPYLDQMVLLSAPAEVMAERMTSRTNNAYGKRPEELARALSLKESVEPLLRKRATIEVDTTPPMPRVVETLLKQCGLP